MDDEVVVLRLQTMKEEGRGGEDCNGLGRMTRAGFSANPVFISDRSFFTLDHSEFNASGKVTLVRIFLSKQKTLLMVNKVKVSVEINSIIRLML